MEVEEAVPGEKNTWETEPEFRGVGSGRGSDAAKNPDVTALTVWIQTQPILPNFLDEDAILTFLEWAGPQNLQDYVTCFYKSRQHYKKIFRHRQPGSPQYLRFSSVVVAPFTTPTTPDWVIFGTWLTDDDPTKFSAYHQAKIIFTELDLLLQEGCLRGKSVAIVMDMAMYTPQHVHSITRYSASTVSRLLLSTVPAQLRGVFLVNPPDYVSDYTKLYPPFDFHILEDIKDLSGFLPENLLPSDLGGLPDAPTRQDFVDQFTQRLWRHAGWLADEELQRDKELYRYSTAADPAPVTTPRSEKKPKKKGAKK